VLHFSYCEGGRAPEQLDAHDERIFSGFSSALAAVAPAGTIGVIAEGAVWC
jgi:hypothetical protein